MTNDDLTGKQDSPNRDYSTISPSAKSLLLIKGLTNIPYAREAASLLVHPEKYDPDVKNKEAGFWARVVHFENRYWSIDQLLTGLDITNFLELSSGFSFRGLDMVNKKKVHYIDTDLPEVTALKKSFISVLQNKEPEGTLETLTLNALDEKVFEDVVSHFSEGPIIILNEGLLMYLGLEEKMRLCNIIHKTLEKHGGYWITADIYLKRTPGSFGVKFSDLEKNFFEQHRIEENKFNSFEEAKEFFSQSGFIIDKIAEPDRAKLTALTQLVNNTDAAELQRMREAGKIQSSWRLKLHDLSQVPS